MNPKHPRSPRNQTINGAFPEWASANGIFSAMASLPWESSLPPVYVDILYHGYHSGMKFCSPFLYHFMDSDGEISGENLVKVATAVETMFGNKWEHLWKLYTAEYGPLDSYDIEERTARSGSGTDTGTDTKTYNVKDSAVHPVRNVSKEGTRTPNLTEETSVDETVSGTSSETRTPDITEDVDKTVSGTKGATGTDTTQHGHIVTTQESTSNQSSAGKHGFNSVDAVPTATEQSTGTGNTTETHSGTDTLGTTRSETNSETVSDTKTITGTEQKAGTSSESKDGTETKTTTGTDSTSETERETYTGEDSLSKTGTETLGKQLSHSETETVTVNKRGRLFNSPAQLMDADRSFWLLDYFAIVFDDVDSVIALSIYSDKPIVHLVLDEQ